MAPDSSDPVVTRDTLDLPDGRLLDWTSTGPVDDPVLLHHHGSPGGALPERVWARAAAAHGLRLVIPARPGYGYSDRRPGRSVADFAGDCAALLDALGAERAYITGSSGGGPHALACGALLPDRVLAVATLGSVAPYGLPELDWLAGMGQDNVEEFGAAVVGEPVLRALLEPMRAELVKADAEATREVLSGLLPPVDLAALTGELAEDLAADMADGLARGVDGWIDDDLAFIRPWGFDLDGLAGVSVSVWQGDQDLMVPFAHGRWLVDHVPGVRPHLLPGEGHLSIGHGSLDAVLDELIGS